MTSLDLNFERTDVNRYRFKLRYVTFEIALITFPLSNFGTQLHPGTNAIDVIRNRVK